MEPFWKTKSLEQMNTEEWESLCDGCGRCCLHKLRHEETNELSFTNVACRLLDLESCQCSDYARRQRRVPDCVSLTPKALTGHRLAAAVLRLSPAARWQGSGVVASAGVRRSGYRASGRRLGARPGDQRAAGGGAGGSCGGMAGKAASGQRRDMSRMSAPHRRAVPEWRLRRRQKHASQAEPRHGANRIIRNRDYQGDCLMLKDALYGGINAAVVTADERRPVDRPRPHGRPLPLAAGQWLQRPGRAGHDRGGQQPGHQRAHRPCWRAWSRAAFLQRRCCPAPARRRSPTPCC